MLPKMAFSGFATRYQEPKVEEGFGDITKVDFRVRYMRKVLRSTTGSLTRTRSAKVRRSRSGSGRGSGSRDHDESNAPVSATPFVFHLHRRESPIGCHFF